MKIEQDETESASLAAFGVEAARLLVAGDIPALVERFGYARALGRDYVDAVRSDLASSLHETGATTVVPAERQQPRVTYFKPNDTGLFALVECHVGADNGQSILLELIVTADGATTHITLEDVSAA